jgi:hypothetical protein
LKDSARPDAFPNEPASIDPVPGGSEGEAMRMMRGMRRFRSGLAVAMVAGAALGAGASSVLAAGPAAPQIEFAFSCNATGDALCAPEYFGIRYRVTLEDGGVADVTGAFSKHHRAGPGAGAEPLSGPGTWWASIGPDGLVAAADPHDRYFNVDLSVGPVSFPQTAGHYGLEPAPGISVQVEVLD